MADRLIALRKVERNVQQNLINKNNGFIFMEIALEVCKR